MTDATIQQLTGEVDDLTRKVNDLSNLMALFMVNGLQDAFDGSGNQTFGSGAMRLDNTGIQVSSSIQRGIYWPSAFSASPPTANYGAVVGLNTASAISISGATVLGSVTATFSLYSSPSNAYFSVSPVLWLPGGSVDATSLALDGAIQYRSDLFRFRIRTNGITGNLGMEIESATAPALATAGTITTAGVSAARVAPAGAVTGVILAVGTTGGQMCTVVNESVAASTVTFAVAGTSNVADGVASVIAGLNARTFVWDSGVSLWFPCK